MSRTALVTGATAGIGAAFARRLAGQGYDLVLVARDAERLSGVADELAGRHGVRATPLPADLSTEAGCATVEERLRGSAAGAGPALGPSPALGPGTGTGAGSGPAADLGPAAGPGAAADPDDTSPGPAGEPGLAADPIDLLVNSAGISLHRSFLRSSPEAEARLLRLNVHAVMRLTLAALPGMVERRHGAVVNVSSVAGFGVAMPGSTYSASKAWVTNFSQSVGLSVRRYGVRVMALCPGYTRTEFHQRAGIDTRRMPSWLWLDADAVARDALRDLSRGRLMSVPDWRYKLAAFGLRHAPVGLIQALTRDARGRVEPDTHVT